MPKPLVIVESPAKARTIAGFLGDDYVVESSIGHIRDLPRNAADVPVRLQGRIVGPPRGGRRQRLQAALRGVAGTSGTSGPQAQSPAQGRQRALPGHRRGPRGRVDRLAPARGAQRAGVGAGQADGVPRDHPPGHRAGRATSPATSTVASSTPRRRAASSTASTATRSAGRWLWKKVMPQPLGGPGAVVGTRLLVEARTGSDALRELPPYWDLTGRFEVAGLTTPEAAFRGEFSAGLATIDGRRLATGQGLRGGRAAHAGRRGPSRRDGRAEALAARLERRRFRRALRGAKSRGGGSPAAPVHDLDAAAGGRAQAALRLGDGPCGSAQDLYEAGYITYMRTDSTTLSDQALRCRPRARPPPSTGPNYRAWPSPGATTKKVKNAQEAHEAIRPAGETFRTP